MNHEFTCSKCHGHKIHESDISTGYATDKDGNKVCFECCGKEDLKTLKELQPKEKTLLYWDGKEVTNWPGSLRIKPNSTRKGRHNIAGSREDVWFYIDNQCYHGIQYGNNSQILHIKKSFN